ncbi:MAG: glycine cleavage system protein GcvH [Bdellovibrionales bacterium]|nr:glycine cleavage system protein GcvH [Bdellovibrionales bacterium]
MEFPKDLQYTKEHEWVREESQPNMLLVGITEYAQEKLGDVVHVELPEVGTEVSLGDSFGSVESVKAVSDIYAPVSGVVKEINDTLLDTPELVNEDPYGEAWMLKIEMTKPEELKELLSSQDYEAHIAAQDE